MTTPTAETVAKLTPLNPSPSATPPVLQKDYRWIWISIVIVCLIIIGVIMYLGITRYNNQLTAIKNTPTSNVYQSTQIEKNKN